MTLVKSAIFNQYKTIETLSVPRVEDIKDKMIKLFKIEYIQQAQINETYIEEELREIIDLFSTNEADHLIPIKEEQIKNDLSVHFFSFIKENHILFAPVRKVW